MSQAETVRRRTVAALNQVYPDLRCTVVVESWDTFRDGSVASYMVTISGDMALEALTIVGHPDFDGDRLPSVDLIAQRLKER